jgi:ribose/xylose/arabinose/galactoside ABC-type transport system permease subunit
MNNGDLASRILKSIILPLSLFVVFGILSVVTHNPFLSPRMLIYTMKLTCVSFVIAMAISFQIFNGAFDFSMGAIVYLAIIVGGAFAVGHKYNAYVMALFIIGVAVLLALINGVLYILLRLPPTVISLITLMIYEALTQILNGGRGVLITTKPQYAIFYGEPAIFIITAFMMIFYWALMKFTRFGYAARALSKGQKIAVNFGIKEIPVVIKRYAIVGLFLGVASVLYLGQNLTIEAAQNMESTVVMLSSIMPVMIGGVLARYSNVPVGILLAAMSMQFITVGFVCMGLDSNFASAISGLFILAFIAFTGNLDVMKLYFDRRKIRAGLAHDFEAGAERRGSPS